MRVVGVEEAVEIFRDGYGIPHIFAQGEGDAWFGLGYACAQDRIFQMDFDRRRATGRLGEVLGVSVRSSDLLARKLRLTDSATRDYEKLSTDTKWMFDSYAAGVNAALTNGVGSTEFDLLGIDVEPWLPWHSIAVFKIRHVLMGMWQHKLANAIVLNKVGVDVFRRLDDSSPLGSTLSVPPLGRLSEVVSTGVSDIERTAQYLGFVSEVEPGSNAWVVSARSCSHGHAILSNDSHRALDVPNVYWQAHLSCNVFDVFGATFAGVPGFPHFGFSRDVSWAITHGGADTQDLYVEEFVEDGSGSYRSVPQSKLANRYVENVYFKDGATEEVEVCSTDNGSLVHGSPSIGWGLALRWTGTESYAHEGFEVLRSMLFAKTVTELLDSQSKWVDPVNNFVAADRLGSIGYMTRGRLPIRSDSGLGLPTLGWSLHSKWTGTVSSSEMPRCENPQAGFIMTANNVIIDGDKPYISASFADPFRAERLRQRLVESQPYSFSDMERLQADVTSLAAQRWIDVLRSLEPLASNDAKRARELLIDWDGVLSKESAAALLYGCFRRTLADALYRPLLGDRTWLWMVSGELSSTGTLIRRWLANDVWDLLGGERPEDYDQAKVELAKRRVLAVVPMALEMAFQDAVHMAGEDVSKWRWGKFHYVSSSHPLTFSVDSEGLNLDFPKVELGGDSDTIQAASYGWKRRSDFSVSGLSVFRQVVDMRDPTLSRSIVPGGVSGDPASPNYIDQLELWANHQRVNSWFDKETLSQSVARVLVIDKL